MSDIYEAVRSAIKSKIPVEKEVDGQIVKTNRGEILESVPFHVKRAVSKLQEDEIIPPRMHSVKAGDGKQTYVDKSGTEVFHYIKMPEKFSGLDDFQIDNMNLNWTRHDNEFMIENKSKIRNQPFYKVLKLDISEDGEYQDVLVMAPFPEDKRMIYVKYFISGSEEFIDLIDEKYWNAIISKVEQIIGIGSKRQAEEDAFDVAEKWTNGGKKGDKVTTKPRYFGRTSPRRRKRRNNI